MTNRSTNLTVAASTIIFLLSVMSACPLAGTVTIHDDSNAGCLCVGRVGNVNCDFADIVDIADLVFLIDHLFIAHPPLPNRDEANVDSDPAGIIDIGDLTALINHLYISFPELPMCALSFNSPPETGILTDYYYETFINAIDSGSPVTGVRVEWRGFDLVDHPYFPPPFEFEWRLYGPYVSDFLHGATWERIRFEFTKTAFLRKNGELLTLGQGLTFVVCDTVPVPVGEDSVVLEITCDTILVDTITASNEFGRLDTLLDIDDPLFADDPLFNRIAASSSDSESVWVSDTSDTIYNVFADDLSDTTRSKPFLLWVRARDPIDSTIYDPTPAFMPMSVIDPKFERDIGIFDLQISFSINGRNRDSARVFWKRAIDSWAINRGREIDYVDSIDYRNASSIEWTIQPLDWFSYKVIVLLNDNTIPGMMRSGGFTSWIFTSIAAGVNVWSAQRAPIFGAEAGEPEFQVFDKLAPDRVEDYKLYFGVKRMAYSGWEWYALRNFITGEPALRIEDFIGMYSTNTDRWPDVPIDTALLHQRYMWLAHFSWIDSIAALPEVGWAEPMDGADTMFLYRSLYPEGHFLNDTNFNFEGRPVAHRWETGYFRTVHWMFTPLAFEEGSMQTVIDSVFEWLYDPHLSEPVRTVRYDNARVKVTTAELRERYWRRRPQADAVRKQGEK